MKFDLRTVQMSNVDVREHRRFPEEPSVLLAELIGILAGDGHVKYYKASNDYFVEVCGHAEDDVDYLHVVAGIFDELFNVAMKFHIKKTIRTAYITKRSKGIYSFLQVVGYKKTKCIITVPQWIWTSEAFVIAFARGLFDTDGSVSIKKRNNYPVVSIALKDEKTVSTLAAKLTEMGLPIWVGHESSFDKRNKKLYYLTRIQVSGHHKIQRWFNTIGSSNPKHKKKWGGREIQHFCI